MADEKVALTIEMTEPWLRDSLLTWQAGNPDVTAAARRMAKTYGKSGTLEVTAALCALLDEVDRLTVERDRARDIAVALEQELARVLDLSRGWDELARNIKNPHLAYNEGWADAKFGCADDIQRLLETENQ